MKRISLFASILFSAAFTFGVANAQNALSTPPPAADEDEIPSNASLVADGYIMLQPEAIKQMMTTAEFVLVQELPFKSDDNGPVDGTLQVYALNNMPFIILLSDCDATGCFLIEGAHPIAMEAFGFSSNLTILNEMNRNLPAGTVTIEEDGNVAVRYRSNALPECAMACREAQFGGFLGIINLTYTYFDYQKNNRSVSDWSEMEQFASVQTMGNAVSDLTLTVDPLSASFASSDGMSNAVITQIVEDIAKVKGLEIILPETAFPSLLGE